MRLLFIAFLFCFYASYGQTDSVINIKEFGWTFKLPSDLKIIDAKINAEQQRRGIKLIEGTIDKKVDTSDVILLISAGRDKANLFNANYSNSKDYTKENYDSAKNAINEIFYKTLRSNIPGNFDSVSSIILVDGILFNKFQVNININDKVRVSTVNILALLRNRFFSLNYVYTDDKIGEEIEKMFSESKFEK
jgi:hypothetical protein